ncbi:MAG: putative ligase-like protein, partial [Acidobacteria bacterium]|nr:putative ligase-like protein [Acidobacteriota bacterium]
MPLDEYRAKRDFTRSPEPKGDTRKKARRRGPLRFCVQKHLATQLHYDLRLEHEGVLLSWAVP